MKTGFNLIHVTPKILQLSPALNFSRESFDEKELEEFPLTPYCLSPETEEVDSIDNDAKKDVFVGSLLEIATKSKKLRDLAFEISTVSHSLKNKISQNQEVKEDISDEIKDILDTLLKKEKKFTEDLMSIPNQNTKTFQRLFKRVSEDIKAIKDLLKS